MCPGYEIRLWNETNYDITKNSYMKEAYDHKKWAFVSDYARLDIIYNHGGYYLDTDVRLVKSLDCVIVKDCFFAADHSGVNTGLGFGATKKHPIVLEILQKYNQKKFLINGSPDLTPCTVVNTPVLIAQGYLALDKVQKLNGFSIFPPEYFHPFEGNNSRLTLTKNTVGIHLSTRTWLSFPGRVKSKIRLIFGPKFTYFIKRTLSIFVSKYRQ